MLVILKICEKDLLNIKKDYQQQQNHTGHSNFFSTKLINQKPMQKDEKCISKQQKGKDRLD